LTTDNAFCRVKVVVYYSINMNFSYRFTSLGFAFLLFSVATLSYASGLDRLAQHLNNLQSARANFVQTVIDGRGQILQQTRGQMSLQRPGQFRWEVKQPSKQLLVADGQHIWFYDIDLKQIMIQKQKTLDAHSPAVLLSNSTKNLARQFNINQIANSQEFRLTPKDNSTLIQSIILVFIGNQLREMRLFDKLGQQTNVDFSHFEINPLLSSEDFHFVVPKNKTIEVVKG
jgi:outer membrane lipoprotein carrier protein